MTLLIIAVAVAIASFALGWFRGYKKACDAHDWNLPKVDWKSDPKRPIGSRAGMSHVNLDHRALVFVEACCRRPGAQEFG